MFHVVLFFTCIAVVHMKHVSPHVLCSLGATTILVEGDLVQPLSSPSTMSSVEPGATPISDVTGYLSTPIHLCSQL